MTERSKHADIQGHTARNISLSGVSTLTGLGRLEVGSLFLPPISHYRHASASSPGSNVSGAVMVLTAEGELRPAGGDVDGTFVSVEPVSGTLLAKKIGPHETTGDVDFLGNTVRGAILESPEIK